MIANKKVVLIKHDLNVSKEWQELINIPFQVDELRVKSVLYFNDGTEVATAYVTSSLINDDALCMFMDTKEVQHPSISFLMNKRSVEGSCYFSAKAFSGALSAQVGKLYLLLEFISYQ